MIRLYPRMYSAFKMIIGSDRSLIIKQFQKARLSIELRRIIMIFYHLIMKSNHKT